MPESFEDEPIFWMFPKDDVERWKKIKEKIKEKQDAEKKEEAGRN